MLQNLNGQAQDLFLKVGPKLISALIVLLLSWLLAKLVQNLIYKIHTRSHRQLPAIKLLADGSKIAILLLGIITALGTAGINVTALVASLGLSGFALGFALKDFLSNMLSGVVVLIYQPYHIGDEISVGSNSGKVTEINLRYTVLATQEAQIMIPNSSMLNSAITLLKTK